MGDLTGANGEKETHGPLADRSGIGVALTIDEKLKGAIEGVKGTNGSVILAGYRRMGKTLAIKRIMNDPDLSSGFKYLEIPKYPLAENYAQELDRLLKDRTILEGTPYQFRYIFEGGSLSNDRKEIGKWKRRWLKCLGNAQVLTQDAYHLPANIIKIEPSLDDSDAVRLFNYYAESINSRCINGPAPIKVARKTSGTASYRWPVGAIDGRRKATGTADCSYPRCSNGT